VFVDVDVEHDGVEIIKRHRLLLVRNFLTMSDDPSTFWSS